ncbi:DKNYY domain-containing protein, partial [Dysgonomonas sp. Shenzhen-Wh21]
MRQLNLLQDLYSNKNKTINVNTMKKVIALFILTLLYTHSADLWAIKHHSQESAKVKISCQRKITSLGGGYSKDDFSVYFRGEKLRGASASSFKYLGGGYGKDNW